ncbi:uncharacterized protein LOC106765436 isoform X1 [Vigna radiata var. radiata]|uniref:Uncharacterized protein LOC106765436 isoform X1 n=1 Tax=Vigna radiata var. radiata TaxID=3916 RepID=A0A3Q0F5W4_VIGRR|nr:uncharacterized protein LOC106765436 isoform X1 [Vigna radiata var. radiata]
MNCFSLISSYAVVVGRTARLIANRSPHGCSFPTLLEFRGVRSFRSEFVFTARSFSTKKGRKSGSSSSRLHKAEPKAPIMKKEKDAFYVVRKGDVVGIYSSLADSQAQVGPSVCNPPVSVYKGYSLSKDTEEYLASHGLKNALYTIRAADLKEDLLGMLVPCPFQEPPTKEDKSNMDVSKKRSLGVHGQDEVRSVHFGTTTPLSGRKNSRKAIVEDPLRKQVKLEHNAVTEAPSQATRTCILEFDGASKGNPGKSGAGAVLRAVDGSLICRLREGLGVATNNAAEYRAMILGMKYALKKGFTGIRIQGDSKLVCMQIDGSWKVKNENLSTLYKVAKELKDKFSSFQINHVLRNFNSDADAQANLAINLADGQVQEECV